MLMDDVMVDLNADLVVYRINGKWKWRSRKDLSKADVIAELQSQSERLELKRDLLLEAVEYLTSEE